VIKKVSLAQWILKESRFMPKLPVVTYRRLLKVLEKSGFQLDRTTGSHFIFYNKMDKKRVTVPFHRKELPKGTIMSILRETGITKKELLELLKK